MTAEIRRLVLAALGIAAAVGAIIGAVGLSNSAAGLAAGSLAGPLGWTIPLISIFVIAGAGWLLMSQAPRSDAGGVGRRMVSCPSCGRSVLEDWRLCPYCGADLAPADHGEGTGTVG